jgi:hypothetical protein
MFGDNYGSTIQTKPMFGSGDIRRATATPLSYRGPDQSRSAFSRALMDQSRGDMKNTFANFNQEFQQKAQQARSQDVQSQRQNKVQRYGLDREKNITTRQQNMQQSQGLADIAAYMSRAKADSKINTMNNLLNFGTAATALMLPGPAVMKEAGRGVAMGLASTGALTGLIG